MSKNLLAIAQVLTLIGYVWTVIIWYNVSGVLAAFFSLFFPFLAPLWGLFIYWITGEPDTAAEFWGPNLLNLFLVLSVFFVVVSSEKSDL